MRIPGLGPRAVRTRPEFLTNLILIEVVAAGILVMAQLAIPPKIERLEEFTAHGRAVRAVVLPPEPRGTDGQFYLDYEYRVDGRTYRGNRPVSGMGYQKIRPYEPVSVVYLPNSPRESVSQQEIDANAQRELWRRTLFVFAGLLGLVSIGGRTRARRERNMLRDWYAISGKVVDVRTVGTDKGERYNVLLEGPHPNGKDTFRVHLERATPPEVGQDLVVLQDPEGSDRVQLVEDLKHVESPPRIS